MKELLRRSFLQVHGEPDAVDATFLKDPVPHYPKGATAKGAEDRFRNQYTFTTDTVAQKPPAVQPVLPDNVVAEFFKV